jgi:hypothetical protein
MTLSLLTKTITLSVLIFSLVSCGAQKPMVSDVEVQSITDQGDVLVSMEAVLNIGNVSLIDLTLPIYSPKDQKEIGSVAMYTNLQGQNKFEIEVNVSAIANIQSSQGILPNGNMLPLIRDNQVIVIPIQNKANVYLAFSDGVAALGATVAISGLDGVGRSVGSISLFPTFNIGNVLGSAGLYNSRESGKNGFGFFADISSVIDTNNLVPQVASVEKSSISMLRFASVEQVQREPVRLNYSAINPSRSSKRKLDSKLYKLHRKRSKL